MSDRAKTAPNETFTALARKMGATVSELADAAPWDAATCARYVERHADKARMMGAQWPDAQVASAVRMLVREDLDHESVVCLARDRIVALIAERELLLQTLKATRTLVAEGAADGFTDHGWMERLFANQAVLTAAISRAECR